MKHPNWTIDAEENMLLLWRRTWGRGPIFKERDVTMEIINKFGWDKTYEIMYESSTDFHKITTLRDSLDDQRNIKPKDEKKDGGYTATSSKDCLLCGKKTHNEYCGKPACNYNHYLEWNKK